jgi:hypothetical protein
VVTNANFVQYLGAALGGTAALVAAAITKFFNIATPTGTINSLPDAVPGATNGVFIAGTNAATTVTTSLTTTFTGNLTGTVAGKTPAEAGAKMDLQDAPNAAAVTAFRTEMEKAGTELKALYDLRTAYTLVVDANGKVAVPDTQKVSVNSYESNQGPLYLLTGAAYTLAVDSSHRVTVGSNADKTGYALTTADWAKAGDAMKISTGTGAGQLTITSGVVAASGDWNVGKTGYALSSDGLDSVSTTDPTGFPTTFTQKVIALFNRMFSKSELTALTFTTYKANGTTPMMIQSVSDDETTQTVNKGSTP